MNHPSLDEQLTAVLGAGAPGEAARTCTLEAIRSGTVTKPVRHPVRIAASISAVVALLALVAAISVALLVNRTDENNPDVVSAAINLLEPPEPGTVRHITSSALIAHPSIDNPSTARGESWERVNEDGSTTQAVIVYGDAGEVLARSVRSGEDQWLDQDGKIIPPDHLFPVAIPPEVAAAMASLFMNSPEAFLAQLRSEVEFEHTTHRQPDSGNYVISADITEGVTVDEGGVLAGVEVERAIIEIELSESLDRFVRREFSIITPSGEQIPFNRVEFSGWEDVDVSEVDPAVFSTETPMTSAPAE